MALGTFPYPNCRNYFDLVRTIVDGALPTEAAEVQQRVPTDLLQLVHACLTKVAPQRPDVLSLTRFPFMARHAAAPTDLRPYLVGLAPALTAGAEAASAAPTAAPVGGAAAADGSHMLTDSLTADEVLDASLMDDGPKSAEVG